MPPHQRNLVEHRWAERLKQGQTLFNGGMYGVRLRLRKGVASFSLFRTDYAHYLAQGEGVPSFQFAYVAPLPKTRDGYYVLAVTSPGTAVLGQVVNFIGGTLDEHHAATKDPLKANMWRELKEEARIVPRHVNKWSYNYLVSTKRAYVLVAKLNLHLTKQQLEKHFEKYNARQEKPELTGLVFIPATPDGVKGFLDKAKTSKTRLAVPVEEILKAEADDMTLAA